MSQTVRVRSGHLDMPIRSGPAANGQNPLYVGPVSKGVSSQVR